MTKSPDTGSVISAIGASFGYSGRTVISQVNLDIRRGDMLGIIGSNGSGKTTLFRGLLGLIAPTQGRVERGRAAIGYVPQREELDSVYPLTVREIVLMGTYGRIRGGRAWWRSPSKENEAKAGECLEFVGLEPEGKRLFASLSGGQRQRALLARALMSDPEVLMLDEPTAGVDRNAARGILKRLAELHDTRGLTVLIVAHQLDLIRDLAKEVLVVRDGAIQRGPVDEMLKPESVESLFDTGFRIRPGH